MKTGVRAFRHQLQALPDGARVGLIVVSGLLAAVLIVAAVSLYALSAWRSYAASWVEQAHALAAERDELILAIEMLDAEVKAARLEQEELSAELDRTKEQLANSAGRLADVEAELGDERARSRELAREIRADVEAELEAERRYLQERELALDDREMAIADRESALEDREQQLAEREAAAPAGGTGEAEPSRPRTQDVVHPGAFCSSAGATGRTIAGTPMVCKTTPQDSRLRWREQ